MLRVICSVYGGGIAAFVGTVLTLASMFDFIDAPIIGLGLIVGGVMLIGYGFKEFINMFDIQMP